MPAIEIIDEEMEQQLMAGSTTLGIDSEDFDPATDVISSREFDDFDE